MIRAQREDAMSKKVLVATEKPFSPAAVRQLGDVFEAADYEVRLLESYTDKADLLAAVADVDAMIIRSDKVTAEVLDAAKQLKIVVRAGAGYDNIDCAHAAESDVVAMNTPGQNSNAVAELVFGMMVMNARNNYNGKPGTELRGKKIGIHAYGNVGIYVAKAAHGFGMDVFAFDPFVEDEAIKRDGVTPVGSVEELYETCQYVSLHIPENPQTMKSVNFELLSKMPAGGTLINTARLGVIDEDGLMKMFEEREDFVYLSDITPTCKDDIVSKYDVKRYFFTPKKMGAQTAEANINAGVAAATQIVKFFEDGDLTFKVN
jgi:D-3-phosphoglycerate dehydrogenase